MPSTDTRTDTSTDTRPDTPAADTTTGARSARPLAPRAQRVVRSTVTHLVLVIGVLLSIFPFYWLVAMSTNTTADIFGYPPKLTFGPELWTNIQNVFANIDLLSALGNTLIVSLSCAALVMFFCSLAAFTFAKYQFPFKNVLFALLLVTFLVPAQLSLVPNFVIMANLGWIGTLQALIVPGAVSAFGIFLLRQLADGAIPDELLESARIDGAGFFRTYFAIAVPMLRGGLAFLGIFTFIGAWNDYVWPLVVLINPGRQTLQVALSQLNSIYNTDYGMVMAGALMSVVPLIGVFLIGSRHFIANIAAGAVKG
ncbi:carbohydrate ABC transporter permease [Isoptericola sp. NPDC057191]|uniref:carbohydrate ABC transporter permease n=1 Tax=Isoptericola sp. NPDC057191 TaxID=3346041 RepID=UPI003641FCCF